MIAVADGVPPLGAGDRLTRDEFLRRWEADPEIKNAELLHGVVYMSSPVSVEHGVLEGDLGTWLGVYESGKVPEYLAVLLYEQEIRWHILVDGKYKLLPQGLDGIWRSRAFPGLWLDGLALLQGNLAQVLAKLQEGMNSAEHKAFVLDLS